MTKAYLQKLVTSENHLKHVALELVAKYLADTAEEIVGASIYTYAYDPEEEPEEYAEQEERIEVYSLFAEPVTRVIENLAKDLKTQADSMAKTCVCYWPDDERVYPALRALLEQLPLPGSSAFCRDDDEGYRLEVNGELIYEHFGPDEAIEATRQYVEMHTFPTSPDGKEGLN